MITQKIKERMFFPRLGQSLPFGRVPARRPAPSGRWRWRRPAEWPSWRSPCPDRRSRAVRRPLQDSCGSGYSAPGNTIDLFGILLRLILTTTMDWLGIILLFIFYGKDLFVMDCQLGWYCVNSWDPRKTIAFPVNFSSGLWLLSLVLSISQPNWAKSIFFFFNIFGWTSRNPSTYQSILPTYISTYLPIYLYIYLYVHIYVYLSIHLCKAGPEIGVERRGLLHLHHRLGQALQGLVLIACWAKLL